MGKQTAEGMHISFEWQWISFLARAYHADRQEEARIRPPYRAIDGERSGEFGRCSVYPPLRS